MVRSRTKLLRSTDLLRRDLKTFLFHSVTGNKIGLRIDSVMRPRSSSRGRNISASLTVTVTFTKSKLWIVFLFLACPFICVYDVVSPVKSTMFDPQLYHSSTLNRATSVRLHYRIITVSFVHLRVFSSCHTASLAREAELSNEASSQARS